jgi:hypothetical protein
MTSDLLKVSYDERNVFPPDCIKKRIFEAEPQNESSKKNARKEIAKSDRLAPMT